MISRICSGAPIVDPHEGAPSVGISATDEHNGVSSGSRGGQGIATHRIDDNISLYDLRPHGLQVFILKFRTVMGIAQDHYVAGGAECCLDGGCDSRHGRVV